MKIDFPTDKTYASAVTLLTDLAQADAPRWSAFALDKEARTLDVAHSVLASLLQRFAAGLPTILPHWGATTDTWRLVGEEPTVVARHLTHVAAFLLPTYGTPPHTSVDAPAQHADGIGRRGTTSFVWQTPASQRQRVLDKIGLWLRVETQQPQRAIAHQPTYSQLLDTFHGALARSDWDAATAALAQIERRYLCSFENQQYLRIQLLAARRDWSTLWHDPAATALARQRLPRTVQAALIRAFHHTELLPHELTQRFDLALDCFRQNQARLGRLLEGRNGLTEGPIVQTFGYAAVLAQDRLALTQLQGLPEISASTRACLDALAALLPTPVPSFPSVSEVMDALRRRSYDVALALAEQLPDPTQRTSYLWRVAATYPGAQGAALAAWDTLSADDQQWLAADPGFAAYQAQVLPPPARPMPQSWDAWFATFAEGEDIDLLATALDQLIQTANDIHWSPTMLRQLARSLDDIVAGSYTTDTRSTLRRSIAALCHSLINDPDFPQHTQDYIDVYAGCFNATILYLPANADHVSVTNRLLAALLDDNPQQGIRLFSDLQEWIVQPSAQVETAFLDLIDLLVDANVPKPGLVGWIRTWLGFLLDRPPGSAWPRARRSVWLELVHWLHVGDDLTTRLQAWDAPAAAGHAASEAADPLTFLPDGFRISIFAGENISSVQRAATILRQRNPALDVQIVTGSGMTSQAEAHARNTTWGVIVTQFMSHALFYGIERYLQSAPIYPRSRGTSAIVDAIEARVYTDFAVAA